MTRTALLLCLAIAAGLHAKALPDSTRDALLMGTPAWDPATGRVAVVEAPASCCVGMLQQIFLLDAKRGRFLETWGPRDIAEGNDSVAARHDRALLARLERLMASRGTRPLQAPDSTKPLPSSDGRHVAFAFTIDGKARRTRPLPVLTYPAPAPCCGATLDSVASHPEACRIGADTWKLWTLPNLGWALVASYANHALDGCERGPAFRIVRLVP